MIPSILNLRILFGPCVVRKDNEHVGTKALNMSHKARNIFHGILIGISQHLKVYLVHVPRKLKIVYLYDVVVNGILSSALLYTSQPYEEAMDMRPAISYIPYATFSK